MLENRNFVQPEQPPSQGGVGQAQRDKLSLQAVPSAVRGEGAASSRVPVPRGAIRRGFLQGQEKTASPRATSSSPTLLWGLGVPLPQPGVAPGRPIHPPGLTPYLWTSCQTPDPSLRERKSRELPAPCSPRAQCTRQEPRPRRRHRERRTVPRAPDRRHNHFHTSPPRGFKERWHREDGGIGKCRQRPETRARRPRRHWAAAAARPVPGTHLAPCRSPSSLQRERGISTHHASSPGLGAPQSAAARAHGPSRHPRPCLPPTPLCLASPSALPDFCFHMTNAAMAAMRARTATATATTMVNQLDSVSGGQQGREEGKGNPPSPPLPVPKPTGLTPCVEAGLQQAGVLHAAPVLVLLLGTGVDGRPGVVGAVAVGRDAAPLRLLVPDLAVLQPADADGPRVEAVSAAGQGQDPIGLLPRHSDRGRLWGGGAAEGWHTHPRWPVPGVPVSPSPFLSSTFCP